MCVLSVRPLRYNSKEEVWEIEKWEGITLRFVCIFLFNFLRPKAPALRCCLLLNYRSAQIRGRNPSFLDVFMLLPLLRLAQDLQPHTRSRVSLKESELCDCDTLKTVARCLSFSVSYTVSPTALVCSLSALCRICCLLYRENIFLCYTHCVVTVIGKDLDSLSSWWTFNEALFMLQLQREKAEKCQTGPSRRAVWGWKHFEVRERCRGLITRLRCHSCQLPYQSKKENRWLRPAAVF